MMGMYYGLQARTRALTCRKALVDDDLELADASMLEVYYALNLARSVATGSVAGTLHRCPCDHRDFGRAFGQPYRSCNAP
jgi:hypothetical protein